jgi:hypothetical protein
LNSDKEDLITPFEATPTSDGWFDVDLITYNITITEGVDFYVALEFLTDETPCICGDYDYDYPCRNYLWTGTTWDESYDNFMIRATVLNNVYPEPELTTPEPTEPEPTTPETTEPTEPTETTEPTEPAEPTEPTEPTTPETTEPEEQLTEEEPLLSFSISAGTLLAIVAVISIVVVVALVAYKIGKRNARGTT